MQAYSCLYNDLFYLNNLHGRIVITEAKGHEPKLYETPLVIAGLFFKFTIVKMNGPNKNL